MRQRFLSSRIAHFVLSGAATLLGGFLFLLPSAQASTINVISNITTSTTWVASNVYVFNNNLIAIQSGVTLTIASGTVVKFNGTSSGLTVDGTLQANGAAGNQIYFTSVNDNSVGGTISGSTGSPAAGNWADIGIASGGIANITDAVVRYGGSSSGGSADINQSGGVLTVSSTQIATSTLYGLYISAGTSTVETSTFTTNGFYGFYETGSASLTLTSSTFSQNDFTGYVNFGSGATFIPSGNSASENITENGYDILGTLTKNETLYDDGVPYVIGYNNGVGVTIAPGTSLTINPGTIIKFLKVSSAAYIDVKGILNVQGTLTNPVYFTSIKDNSVDSGTGGSTTSTPGLGDWGSIEIDPGASTTIMNAIIRYGGATGSAYYNSADIDIAGGVSSLSSVTVASSSNYGIQSTAGTITISSSTISSNGASGIYAYSSSGTINISSSTFANNGVDAALINFTSAVTFVPLGNTASGNGENGYDIRGTLSTNETLYNDGIPYVIGYNNNDGVTVASGTTLTISSGTVIKFLHQTTASFLDIKGRLNVQGTPTNKVYFTSIKDNSIDPGTGGSTTSTPGPGDWGRIEIDSGASTTINNAFIGYGGYSLTPATDIYQAGGVSTIINSQIADSLDDGININGGTSTITLSEFNGNGHGGIYMNGGMITISTSSIQGNVTYGMYNGDNVTSTAIAENNWWGSTTGPTNAANPGGTGDVASSYVDFNNWLNYSPVNGTTTLSNLMQYKSDATTTLSEGSSTTESIIVFGAKLQSLATSTESLQVEVEPVGTMFTNTVTVSSTYVVPGSNATATFPLVDTREISGNGSYHWQARVTDQLGDTSGWQLFGPNSSSTDFKISAVPLYTQVTSTYPSPSATTGTVWWAPQLLDGIATNTIAGFGCLITSVTMDLRSYGITTTTMQSYMSSTDVNPANLNDWLEMANSSGTGYFPAGSGLMNWQDIPYYSETPSGTFRVWYNVTTDHISSPSSTWVNKWLDYTSTGTVPVILTEGNISGVTHFVVATGFANNNNTSTYTLRDPFFYNTQYLNQASSTANHIYGYANTYASANILEPTSTAVLPLYLEYTIDSMHTLLITDPNGNKLGINLGTGVEYNQIPDAAEDDSQPGVRFLTIYHPIDGNYTLSIGGSGKYELSSFVADGKHMPIPQIISSTTPSSAAAIYHQDYNSLNLSASTVQ